MNDFLDLLSTVCGEKEKFPNFSKKKTSLEQWFSFFFFAYDSLMQSHIYDRLITEKRTILYFTEKTMIQDKKQTNKHDLCGRILFLLFPITSCNPLDSSHDPLRVSRPLMHWHITMRFHQNFWFSTQYFNSFFFVDFGGIVLTKLHLV